jgi:two-component system, cell cycle sensor histidine kinase and response regulator CckA
MGKWSRHFGDDHFSRAELTGETPMSTAQILVVEDERLVATALQNELEHFGYEVSGIVSTAKDAVETAMTKRPDLVLMDIHLQGEGDGIDAARSIQSRCGIPVVYLSAFSDPDTVNRASQTQAFGYLLKPYEEQELQTTIEMAIAKHRAEQQLEETQRWLEAVHHGIGDAVIAIDREHCIRFMNIASEPLTAWRAEDAVGVSALTVCQLVEKNGRNILASFIDKAANEHGAVSLPAATRIVSKDDREIPVEGTLSMIRDSRGDVLGTVLVLRDITARLELERLRKQREQRKQRAQKTEALSRLAGGLAGQLRKWSTAILADTSLALTAVDPQDEVYGVLRRVEVSAQRAGKMIARAALLSRVSEHSHTGFVPVDLNEFIPECMNEIQMVLDRGLSATFTLGAGLRPIPGDELLLGQLLLEIALNAQDAMSKGGHFTLEVENVTITADDLPAHPEANCGNFVRIRASDTGRGMPPEIRARIFEPCFTTKKTGQAAGLGLSLAQAVVDQHHGWIECFSKLNHGTQFDIYLPCRRIDEGATIAAAPSAN